jgi:cellulose synthase/poly-beta-1,6-N-acetylglucosamine synthase-like glycosyltransferase
MTAMLTLPVGLALGAPAAAARSDPPQVGTAADPASAPPTETASARPTETASVPPPETASAAAPETASVPPAETASVPPPETASVPPAETASVPPAETASVPPAPAPQAAPPASPTPEPLAAPGGAANAPAPRQAPAPTTADQPTPIRRAAPGPTPTVSAADPLVGSTDGGTRVLVTGQFFFRVTQVLFGGTPGTDVDVVSDSQLWVTTPPRAEAGEVNVRVFTVNGRSPGASPVDFEYARPPVITGIYPSVGSDSGGTLVSIEGTDLSGASRVTFGSVDAQVVKVASDVISAITPAQPGAGPVDVRITTPGGSTAVGPAGQFAYAVTPAVTGLSPTTGLVRGGTVVTIRGSHLDGVTEVAFGDVPGTELTVVSDQEVRVTTPARTSSGEIGVRVTTAAGTNELDGANDFTYQASPPTRTSQVHGYWPLGLIGLLSWSVWFVRRFLSHHRYLPVVNDYRTTTSVVVPVYREDPEVVERCLRSWLREDPTEVILVVDDRDELLLEHLNRLDLDRVRIVEWRHTGKRGALGVGIRSAVGQVVLLVDSDTEWRPGLLASMQMPFVDPMVGGVGSRQHVYLPQTSIWRRIAYWMLNSRYLDYVPAMSRRGSVACLSGRTAAYRREVIVPLLPALEHELFLGRQCVAGDDGRLTWLVLAAGYRTVHQASAQADSMFPAEWSAFVRQRMRWSRNSYRCYLTALSQGWLWRRPFITQVTVLQVLLTPVSMGAAIYYGARWIAESGGAAAGIVLAWAVAGRAIRATSHLRENPRELVLAPVMTLIVAFIALPLKLWAALTMNSQGWLTRYEGARVQGQAEIGVVQHVGQV